MRKTIGNVLYYLGAFIIGVGAVTYWEEVYADHFVEHRAVHAGQRLAFPAQFVACDNAAQMRDILYAHRDHGPAGGALRLQHWNRQVTSNVAACGWIVASFTPVRFIERIEVKESPGVVPGAFIMLEADVHLMTATAPRFVISLWNVEWGDDPAGQ